MNKNGIGPQGLGKKGHNGFWIGSPAKKVEEPSNVQKAYRKAAAPYYKLANRAEAKLDSALDYPMLKANKRVDKYTKEHSGYFDDVDKIRHGAASMYTRQAISKKVGGGVLGKVVGVIGSNILGAGHELGALNTDHGYVNGIIEAGKDMANNFVGSLSNEKNLESNMRKYGNSGMSAATRKERLIDMQNERDAKPKSSPAKKACWKGYERTPGTKKGAKGSCRKK